MDRTFTSLRLWARGTLAVARLSAIATAAVLFGAATQALALDANATNQPPAEAALIPPAKIGSTKAAPDSPDDEFRQGSRLYFQGHHGAAVTELNRAADRGHPGALYLLGRMYRSGDGVPANDLKAFQFFSKVAEAHDDEPPGSASAAFVASSYVALGSYYLTGIQNSDVKPDFDRAREIFTYAASQYGDADAQYKLGRLYLSAGAEQRNPKMAARWLNSAAKKGQIEAMALLGQLLFSGDDDLPRRPVAGLTWLTAARAGAHGPEQDWIIDAQEQAFSLASEQERRQAVKASQGLTTRAASQ